MIISPPFLPDLQATEEVFLDAAMVPAPDGRYPVSAGLQWHNGTHLQAPMENNQYLPVRAVADGEVIFGVPPDAQPSADPQHAQNYPAYPVSTSYPGEPVPAHRLQWTDKGLLILRHTTEIGASGNTPGNTATRVTYYSVYMHLKEFAATLKPGAKVLRKDVLGRAGQIYGQHGRIHFEICCDEANLARLLGPQRPLQWAQPDRAPTADGRTDAVFGSVYVYLPAGAPAQATKPADALTRGTPASNALAASQWVEVLYQRGDATLRSYRATDDAASGQRTGDAIGSPVVEVGGEYALFDEANRRHAQALRQDPSLAPPNALAHSSPSGWLELLRFGRNLGIDPLPANAAHWRKIATPQGEVWADLNASGAFKFSDADFPAIRGWQCIADDSNPQDQRCDSTQLKLLLLTGLLGKEREETLKDRQKLQARLDQVHIRARLAQLICKFPTEWDQTSVAQRYGWHAELPEYKEDPKRLEQLMGHIRALTCNPPQEYKDAGWHLQPRAFIGVFRRCGWLSGEDLARLLKSAPASGKAKAQALLPNMNVVLRKYGIADTRLRVTHFLAQVAHETGWWRYREEGGSPRYWRTMYEEITAAEAAEDYRLGDAQKMGLVKVGETEIAYANRRPGVVATKALGLGNGAASASTGGRTGDGVRFRGRGFLQITGRSNYVNYGQFRGRDFTTEPENEKLSVSDFNVCDTAGFYWARQKINGTADAGFTSAEISRVGGAVNRGSTSQIALHNAERLATFTQIWTLANDRS